jgi:hypothetical protein
VAVREEDSAVVVTQHQSHARGVGLREDLGHGLDVLLHAIGEAQSRATHRLEQTGGEQHGRHQWRPRLHHPLDALLVQAVTVVDDVDVQVERHEEGFAIGDMAAYLRSP